ANGHGNSVPRFHLTWGTGPGVLAPFVRGAEALEQQGAITFKFRHRVDGLIVINGRVDGIYGSVLAPDNGARGEASNRDIINDFRIEADAVVVTSGGIGGNHELVRRSWPVERLGEPPKDM